MAPLNRREFARKLAASAAFGAGLSAQAQDPVNPENKPAPVAPSGISQGQARTFSHPRTAGTLKDGSLHENARTIPVKGSFDVIVCGGGPAGFASALAAARQGARVLLLEVNGCVGGIWTAGLLSWILDAKNKTGIMAELIAKLEESGQGRVVGGGGAVVYHPDPMKLLLEQMLLQSGVRIRLHTRVVGAITDASNRLQTVLTESKSGREAWTGTAFIDATGDGDLAAQAGCGFDFGRPGDGITQPFSLLALLTGVKTDDIAPFINHVAESRRLGTGKGNLLAEFRRAGIDPSYGGPSIFEIRDGLYAMMANHQYNVAAIDADDVTRATLEARLEVHRLVDALRKAGGVWKNLELVTTGEHIGTREGRRVHGRLAVNSDALRDGAKFDDNICRVTFGIDVHATDPRATKGIEDKPFKARPYDVPLRALLAKDVDGLMLAGRCISGDFIAHSSYRVTGNSVAMGEAAGLTSALACRHRVLPHEVPYADVKEILGKAAAIERKQPPS